MSVSPGVKSSELLLQWNMLMALWDGIGCKAKLPPAARQVMQGTSTEGAIYCGSCKGLGHVTNSV